MKQIVLVLALAMVSGLSAQTAVQNSGSSTATTNSSAANQQQEPQGVVLSAPSQQQDQADTTDVADLLAPRPLPPNPRLSLIGGMVVSLDRVRNRMEVKVFGGKKLRIDFDERSHIYRDGVETTSLGIRKGDRVYVDTLLYGSQVFAKNIHVAAQAATADVEGQLESVDLSRKSFVVRDKLTGMPMPLSFAGDMAIVNQGHSGSSADLQTGALVRVHFSSSGAGRDEASSVNVLAAPGRAYIFYGEISHIDKRENLIAIRSIAGDRFYDISVEGSGVPDDLRIGSTAKVTARFDGAKYVAQQISIEQPHATPSDAETRTESPANEGNQNSTEKK